jgi:hypothetical protein
MLFGRSARRALLGLGLGDDTSCGAGGGGGGSGQDCAPLVQANVRTPVPAWLAVSTAPSAHMGVVTERTHLVTLSDETVKSAVLDA